jgi:SAM-dependent methyltransferase
MSGRDARDDWRRFAAGSIPTKTATPQLDAFLDACLAAVPAGARPALLDVGCGDGRLAQAMLGRGFAVTGIDVNEGAVAAARQRAKDGVDALAPAPRFLVADAAGGETPHGLGGPFDVVVCQLVVSIAGGPADRGRLLRACADLLRPGGRLFVSASGVSGDVNPAYARLYAEDEPLTGEPFTYYSRDADGRVLYATHHFSEPELAAALAAAGFTQIAIAPVVEASSRRPEERAIFLYATASRPPGPAT